ncbi:MAG: hypothetical protein ABSF91_04015 [Bacteroidota bacterium]
MKCVLFVLVICLLFMGLQKHSPSLVGKWWLDLKKSENLPSSFKSIDRYEMEIQQVRDSMTVLVELIGSGQDVKFPSSVYKFNGPEMFREDSLRGIKRWYKARWVERGKKFSVTTRVEQHSMKGGQRFRQTEMWEILDDGTLRVSMTQRFPPRDSTVSQRRYFHRVK